jgi:signal transduction histidine kinase
VQPVVEAHGDYSHTDRKEGVGSIFIFSLPYDSAS